MKFKIGDKIKILPSATDMGVSSKYVGKTGTIKEVHFLGKYILVEFFNKKLWAVSPHHIKRVIEKGQQLLFPFMEEE